MDDKPQPDYCIVCDSPVRRYAPDGYRVFTCGAAFNPKTLGWTKSCRRAFDTALALEQRLIEQAHRIADLEVREDDPGLTLGCPVTPHSGP